MPERVYLIRRGDFGISVVQLPESELPRLRRIDSPDVDHLCVIREHEAPTLMQQFAMLLQQVGA